jgi:hypothetical protein
MEKAEGPSNEKNSWRKETEEKIMHAGTFFSFLRIERVNHLER